GKSKDDDGNSDADDNKRTNSDDDDDDDDENPSFTLKDYDEEEHDEEYESDDDYKNVYKEVDDDMYKDVDVRSLGAEHEKERKGDEEMTDADQNVSQKNSYEQVVEDAHVTLTSSQKTESLKQSSFVSYDFASKFLILENVPPIVDEVDSMMNVKSRREESSTQAPSIFTVPETAIPETATTHATTVPPTISMITPLPQLTIPSPALTTVPTTTSVLALHDFSSMFGFDQRVSTLETELIGYATRTSLHSYTKKFEKKAQEERKLYIDVVEKSSTIMESLENVVLANSLSQPQSTNEATTSLTDFELKKILLDKLEKSKSYRAVEDHKNLYDALVKSYQLDKDLFDSYGKAYSLKRSHEDKDKDKDPLAGPDQGLKKKKISKDAEPSRGSNLKESKSSSSKGSKSNISKLTPYTAYKSPQGIIYQDKLKRNRLMLDELYKFCDGTLTSVRRVLYDIASSLEMDYLPKRTWSKLDRKRSSIMIKAIDQQLFERRLMRNLEKFVGGRDYGNDFRLFERII
ncbi:hypothetical protein Tco_0776458, partial [Tanacetum coccineum]